MMTYARRRAITATAGIAALVAMACRVAEDPELRAPWAVLAPAIDTLVVGTTGHLAYVVVSMEDDTIGGFPVVATAADTTVVTVLTDSTYTGKRIGSTVVTLKVLDSAGVPRPGVEADVLFQVVTAPAFSI